MIFCNKVLTQNIAQTRAQHQNTIPTTAIPTSQIPPPSSPSSDITNRIKNNKNKKDTRRCLFHVLRPTNDKGEASISSVREENLFPLDRRWWLTRNIVNNTRDTINFIDNTVRYFTEEIVWQVRPMCGHEVDCFYCT